MDDRVRRGWGDAVRGWPAVLIGGPRTRRPRPVDRSRPPVPAPPQRPPLVVVLLGDSPHSFDRLLRWSHDLVHELAVEVFAQHGVTALPAGLAGTPHLDSRGLDDVLDRAAAVVTHGGALEVLASRTRGHQPVAVARSRDLGEHADDHQRDRVARLVERGLCSTASSRQSLVFEVGAVLAARALPPRHADTAAPGVVPGGSPWRP